MVSCGPLLPEGGTAFCFRQQKPHVPPALMANYTNNPGKSQLGSPGIGSSSPGQARRFKAKKVDFSQIIRILWNKPEKQEVRLTERNSPFPGFRPVSAKYAVFPVL